VEVKPMRSGLIWATMLVLGAGILAAQQVKFKKFTATTKNAQPWGITTGPDGALWFTEFHAGQIGRITTEGAISEYPIPTAKSGPWGITTGPDGALWFTEGNTNKIGRITTAGTVTAEYVIPTTTSLPWEIVTGPDGALWFTELNPPFCIAFACEPPPYNGYIERITTAGAITVFPLRNPIGGLGSPGITVGPDGALWFSESANDTVGSISTTGALREFPLPSAVSIPQGIVTGPDGALWFAEANGSRICRITTAGIINECPVEGGVYEITLGPDGALWFTTALAGRIGRLTTTGALTEYDVGFTQPDPISIVTGPDGALWFTDPDNNAVVQAVIETH
jgi:virginiamycin B lyase